MSTPILELEGTWEELLMRSTEFVGHPVRVFIYPRIPTFPSEQSEQSALPTRKPRIPGSAKGIILHIAEDFDAIPEGFEDYVP